MQIAGHCIEIAQCRRCGIGQLAAFSRQAHTARMALEQDGSKQVFQPPHMVADRTGGKVQLLGGVGEVLVACGNREHPQRGQQGRAKDHGRDPNHICGLHGYYALVSA
ncbi:hypothetical protein D3C71_1485660 [compost metagenome]